MVSLVSGTSNRRHVRGIVFRRYGGGGGIDIAPNKPAIPTKNNLDMRPKN